jgi:hypothetical protein
MWKANGKTTTLQLFLTVSLQKNMRDASSGDKLKIALFGELSLEEAMDLSRDRQILEKQISLFLGHNNKMIYHGFMGPLAQHASLCLSAHISNGFIKNATIF